MNVIVAGGRDFRNKEVLYKILNDFYTGNTIEQVVCGGARGADSLGACWAEDNFVEVKDFPANWDKFGKSAGYRRNVDMANYADCLILFWDGKSKGSKHMLDIMKSKNKPYFHYDYSGNLVDWRA